jgi:hypothetical protein
MIEVEYTPTEGLPPLTVKKKKWLKKKGSPIFFTGV